MSVSLVLPLLIGSVKTMLGGNAPQNLGDNSFQAVPNPDPTAPIMAVVLPRNAAID